MHRCLTQYGDKCADGAQQMAVSYYRSHRIHTLSSTPLTPDSGNLLNTLREGIPALTTNLVMTAREVESRNDANKRVPRRIFPSPVMFCRGPIPSFLTRNFVRLEMQSNSETLYMDRFFALHLAPARPLKILQCTISDNIAVLGLGYFHCGSRASRSGYLKVC